MFFVNEFYGSICFFLVTLHVYCRNEVVANGMLVDDHRKELPSCKDSFEKFMWTFISFTEHFI